jgi:hypothetical protein
MGLVVKNGSKALERTDGRHARAVVADGEHQVIAGLDRFQRGDVAAIEVHVGGFDQQLAAIRHRVPGVDDQVEQGVFQLADVGADRPYILGQTQFEFDRIALGPADQVFQ